MLISNPDLINSCRICRATNQIGDYECLYDMNQNNMLLVSASTPTEILVTPPLSDVGRLYENLFSKLSPETYEYYPRFLCNSCGLQMRLFRKLKEKAINTMSYLAKIYDEVLLVCREEQKIDNENEEELIAEQSITSVQETGTQPLLEMTNNASATGQFIIPQTEVSQVLPQGVFLIPVAMQEPNNNVEQQQEEMPSTNDVLENHQLNEELEKCSSVSEVADLEQCVGLDKSDYVLEIYKVLEDGTQTVVSESTAADEEDQIRDLEEFQVEEELSSQFDNNDDDPYVDVDSLVSGETNDTEFYATRKRRRMDSSTASVITIDNNVKVFSCTECSEIFTCAKEFKHHRTYIHAQNYPCEICSTVYKSQRSLAIHKKTHFDEEPSFQCEICQRTFKQKVHYQYHMNRHNNIRNFSCDQCDKSFLSKSDLRVHQRQHTGQRAYVCEVCGKSYMLAEHLKTHSLKHTGEKFPCELCQQMFATPKTLRQHITTIHVAEPKFKCEFCSKSFRRKHHLQYHMMRHPKNILADPDFNSETDLDVDNPDDIVAAEDNQKDFIVDSGFVALSEDDILI